MKISFSSRGSREAVGSCGFASGQEGRRRDGNAVPDISRQGQPYKPSSGKVYRRLTHPCSLGDMCASTASKLEEQVPRGEGGAIFEWFRGEGSYLGVTPRHSADYCPLDP
jgi:hypothetical protein